MSRTAEERFWAKVRKAEGDGCWVWTGTTDKNGYGYFNVDGRRTWVHRYSRELHAGAIPGKLLVCHKCDNPPCVRPDHFFLGTHADNSRDMARKGRSARGDRNGSRVHIERIPRGEGHYRAKLTDDAIRAIRASSSTGASLADEHGVSRALISLVKSGKRWAHVV